MLIDTFMFYNEVDVLETRLKNLSPYVDLFILVESEVTHMNTPKELYFNKDKYTSYNIKHIIVKQNEMPQGSDPWSREMYQRHCILEGIDDSIPSDALVMVSDVDEIPDLKKFKFIHPVSSLHMTMFEYSYDYIFTGEPWIGTVVTNKDLFVRMGPNYFRNNRWKFNIIKDCGWHLSSFGDYKHVWNKINTYAHANDDKHKGMSIDDFKIYLEKGLHSDGMTRLISRPKEVSLPHII